MQNTMIDRKHIPAIVVIFMSKAPDKSNICMADAFHT